MAILQVPSQIVTPWLFVGVLVLATIVSWMRQFKSPLRGIPGPRSFALTKWRLAIEDWKGSRTRKINALHGEHGPVVCIGPNEVSFNSLTALQTIYGAGSKAQRSNFYRMFDVYGRQNLFTFGPWEAHAQRKKLLSHAYAKSAILKGPGATMVEEKTSKFLKLLNTDMVTASEIFTSLHYFSLDAITAFLYGPKHGGTSALTGTACDRALLNDIIDPSRRRLSWFWIHLPVLTSWLYTRQGLFEQIVTKLKLLPMQKPTTYTSIRIHALDAWNRFKRASDEEKRDIEETTLMGRLWKSHTSQKAGGLDDLDIASECADHLLAGIDTTSDTLMFLIWALSLPESYTYQEKLAHEIAQLDPSKLTSDGIPSAQDSDQLPYLNAVINETLRLYAPLPASEPRVFDRDMVIDGHLIPAGTVVGIAPYTLHRNAQVFHEPLRFNPDRWLGDSDEIREMKRWWWAFSSGGRMCIGMQ